MLLEDKVLRDPSRDELGRKTLVEIMTDSILSKIKDTHGPITYGVLGAWGEGKSTFMRMVQTSLEANSVETIWYDPWEVSDEKKMTVDFFSLLAEHAYNNPAIGIAFSNYGRAFLSQGDSRLMSPVLSDSVARLSKCIPFLPKSFAAAKEAISNQLKSGNKHLIVFIDDVDRLDEKEVHVIFRLIRQIADFDNVIYILGLDPEVVSSILANGIDDCKETGRIYLNKMVQVPVVLPPVKDENLSKLLSGFLSKLVNENSVQVTANGIECVAKRAISLLKTKRDIIRYINQLSFVLPAIHVETEFEDLCISELLKYQSEEGWLTIYQSKDALLGSRFGNKSEERFNNCVEEIARQFPEEKRAVVKELITDVLFTTGDQDPARKSINNSLYFSQYFVCGIPWGIIAREDVLVLKQRIESVDEGKVLKWINSKAKMFPLSEVDRASRTALAIINREGKSTEKATFTLSRLLAQSDLSQNYSYGLTSNSKSTAQSIACVLIPSYLGKRDPSGNFILNKELETQLLNIIFKGANLVFCMHLFYWIYSPHGAIPWNEKEPFDVLKKRAIKKENFLFNYSYPIQLSFWRLWKRLDVQEFNGFLKQVMEKNGFDVCGMIVRWLEDYKDDEDEMTNVAQEMSRLFYDVRESIRSGIERSKKKNDKLVRFFSAKADFYRSPGQ